MKNEHGFTVIELLVTMVFLGVASTVGYTLVEAVQMTHRDQDRKVAINTIQASLEEVVKPKIGAYPRTLSAAQLTALDKSSLIDPKGALVGDQDSDYRYEPTGCAGGELCSGYRLIANLELEPDFIKYSR